MPELAPFDPERIFGALMAHGVEFVLVGALAARMQGFPRMTADADLTPRRTSDNLERLAVALRELEARVYTESVPEGLSFDCSATALGRSEMWNLVTNAGRVDLIFTPAGTGGFNDLAPRAVSFTVYGGTLHVARLEDILRSKEAADRPQDRHDAAVLRAMLGRSIPPAP